MRCNDVITRDKPSNGEIIFGGRILIELFGHLQNFFPGDLLLCLTHCVPRNKNAAMPLSPCGYYSFSEFLSNGSENSLSLSLIGQLVGRKRRIKTCGQFDRWRSRRKFANLREGGGADCRGG